MSVVSRASRYPLEAPFRPGQRQSRRARALVAASAQN